MDANGFIYLAGENLWLRTNLPLVAELLGIRQSVLFFLIYFVGRSMPDLADDPKTVRAIIALVVVTCLIGVTERFLVPPEGLVALGVASYFQNFLDATALTVGNEYGLPTNYWIGIGGHLVRRGRCLTSSGGDVIQSVRVVAGKTETLDLPVFSGWIAVLAPVILDVASDGKSIGNTDQSRMMLPPGKHLLTFTNKELGYTGTQEVLVEPGEVKSVSVEPKGPVNLNALPWAEVWLDGTKLGDTPLAGTAVPIGLHEFVFKNPQFGERKVSATIKASGNPPVTVDFSK